MKIDDIKAKQAERLKKFEHLKGIKLVLIKQIIEANISLAAMAAEIGVTQQTLQMYFTSEGEHGGINIANKLIEFFDLKIVKIL